MKRGSGIAPESLDSHTETTPAMQVADSASMPDDTVFDREWALAVMDRALQALAAEFARADKAEQFIVLKPWMVGDAVLLPPVRGGRAPWPGESAVKVAIHRFRKRFREVIRSEIAQTVDDAAAVDGELRYLVEVMARG